MKTTASYLSWLFCFACSCYGQGVISTIAGTDWVFSDNGKPAIQASIGHLGGIATDSSGAIYVADSNNNLVFKVDGSGILTVIAGNGIAAFSGEGGPATKASLNGPLDVALDPSGNLYIADSVNGRVRKVDKNGIITTYAGTGQVLDPNNPNVGQGENIPATQATVHPIGLFFDSKGLVLYVADTDHNKVRKIDATGRISTVAGNGQTAFNGDNQPATSASLYFPRTMALDANGNLFIADAAHFRIREVTANGIISTVMGSSVQGLSPSPDGTLAANALLNLPFAVAFDKAGNTYVVDEGNNVVQMISAATKMVRTIAGTGRAAFSGDGGPATAATLSGPGSLAFDALGNLLVGDGQNSRVRRISNSIINTIAGNGQYKAFANGSRALQAFLSKPQGINLDVAQNIYIADTDNNRIRRITPDGLISTVAGTGDYDYYGDAGPAVAAALAQPRDVVVDTAGNVYIADSHNTRVRKVSADGVISSIACGQLLVYCGPLVDPQGLAIATDGTIYVADGAGNAVLRINVDGTVANFAGTGDPTCNGDGGPAANACVSDPQGVALDQQGNVYIADTGHNTIRMVTADGTIQTIVGNGQAGFGGDGGPALQASLSGPAKIAFDRNGALYIADTGNHVVRVVTNGLIGALAGTGAVPGYAGDGGLAAQALLHGPAGVVVDASGNVVIADTINDRIRVVSLSTPVLVVQAATAPAALQFATSLGGGPVSPQQLNITITTDGRPSALPFAIGSDTSWLLVSQAQGTSPATVQVSVMNATALGRSGTFLGDILISAPAISGIAPVHVPVVFTVGGSPTLGTPVVNPTPIALTVTQQSPVATASIQVTGDDGSPVSVATTGEPWLQASSPSSPQAGSNAFIMLRVDLSNFAPGTYRSAVTITVSGPVPPVTVPVTVLVSAPAPALALSRSSLTFIAVAGGGTSLPPQKFAVINRGSNALQYAITKCASVASCSGTPPAWLSVDTTSGTAGSTAARVTVAANPSGLAAGNYQALVRVEAEASSSPQFLSVLLNVVPSSADPGPAVTPQTLVFNAQQNGTAPGSQQVVIYNLGTQPLNFTVFGGTLDNGNWLTYKVPSPPLNPGQPLRIEVQTDPSHLQPGLYRAALTFLFQNAIRNVAILLSVNGSNAQASARTTRFRSADSACVPDTSVQPVITALGTGTTLPALVPAVIDALVMDPGGCPLTTGNVMAQVNDSSGAAPVALNSLGDGTWEGLWTPNAPGSSSVIVAATDSRLMVSGTSDEVQADIGAPLDGLLSVGNVVSVASLSGGPVAPGSLVSILGFGLGPRQSVSQSLPWNTQLSGVTARLGGALLPVSYVSGQQLNTVIPFDVQPGTVPQLVIAYEDSVSHQQSLSLQPLPVAVTVTQPAIFSQDGSGAGPGWISNAKGLISSSNPATGGSSITIRCAGLGAVTPAISVGAPVPASPAYATVQPVWVSFGPTMMVQASASLKPGASGEYNVMATAPSLSSGVYDVTVTAGAVTSPPVSIVIQ